MRLFYMGHMGCFGTDEGGTRGGRMEMVSNGDQNWIRGLPLWEDKHGWSKSGLIRVGGASTLIWQ